MLSAFFGLDHRLPPRAAAICAAAPGLDGIVVNVADELDTAALRPDQWTVITRSGRKTVPVCASLAPAIDPGERRTVLLIGDLGTAADPPVRIEVPTALPTVDPSRRARYRGAVAQPVTPLDAGPRLVIAERVERPRLGGAPTGPDGCPAPSRQVIRVAWEGGITRPDGAPTTNADAARYHVRVRGPNGTTLVKSPIALADVNDGDNYHQLCLATSDRAITVQVDPNSFVDPNGDANPATRVAVPSPPRERTPLTTAETIPVAHTPPGFWTTMPPPVLSGCTERLARGVPDLRGTWRAVSATRNGSPVRAGDPTLSHVERIEQCGNRVIVISGGVTHDMRADGTRAHGVHDIAESSGVPIEVVAAFERGELVLRPVGISIEVTRRLDGKELVWHYGPTIVVRMRRS